MTDQSQEPTERARTQERETPDDTSGGAAERDATARDQKAKPGPTDAEWWLEDGPESPIAADIDKPEKHL